MTGAGLAVAPLRGRGDRRGALLPPWSTASSSPRGERSCLASGRARDGATCFPRSIAAGCWSPRIDVAGRRWLPCSRYSAVRAQSEARAGRWLFRADAQTRWNGLARKSLGGPVVLHFLSRVIGFYSCGGAVL
jgi:hypothetical protein